jgi:hypothetical protein
MATSHNLHNVKNSEGHDVFTFGVDGTDGAINVIDVDAEGRQAVCQYTWNGVDWIPATGVVSGTVDSNGYVWDVASLSWVKGQQPILNAGSVTIPAGITVNASALPTGAATSANQTDGSQKTRVLDQNGTGIDSVSQGTGANGLLVGLGPTNFIYSEGNSTTHQLDTAETFTGTTENIIAAQSLSLMLTCDQPGTLIISQYITDTGDAVMVWTFGLLADQQFSRSFTLNGNYLCVTFHNTGASPTTTLNINTYYGIIFPSTSLGNLPMALSEINGEPLVTADTGVPKVGVVGNAGAAFDVAREGVAPPNLIVAGGVYHATPPTLTEGQADSFELDSAGNLKSYVTNIPTDTLESIAGFNIPKYDEVVVAYPSGPVETYSYKLDAVAVGTITVTYSDSTKTVLTHVVKS